MRELMEALDAYPRGARERVTLEYVLLKGISDTPAEISALKALLKPRRGWVKVNLIPFNPVPGLEFQESSEARVNAIGAELSDAGFTVTVRRSLGRDIRAACGQLAAEPIKNVNGKE
jgi:23S rRNA (adenine2503-C2)-methyltransferase